MSFLGGQSHEDPISSPSSSEDDKVIDSGCNINNSRSHSSASFHHSLDDMDDDHSNMEEIQQACRSNGDISEFSNKGLDDQSCNEEVSCYDSCQEEIPIEKSLGEYLDETLDDDDGDDETLEDSMDASIASTVVRDFNRLKDDIKVEKEEEGYMEVVVGSSTEKGVSEHWRDEPDLGDSSEETDIPSVLVLDVSVATTFENEMKINSPRGFDNTNDSNDCSLTQIVGSASLHHVHVGNLSNADSDNGSTGSTTESEDTEMGDCEETEESNLSKDKKYSPIDTSLYRHPSVQEMNETHVDTSVVLEMMETPQQRVNRLLHQQSRGEGTDIISKQLQHSDLHEEAVTSPLDRFQVQVYNGGTKCKVTPIGNDILRATQSPILRMQSPTLPPSVSSRERRNKARTDSSQIQNSLHASFQSPPIQKRVHNKVYPKTPLPVQHKEVDVELGIQHEPDRPSADKEDTDSFYSSNTSQEDNGEHSSSDTESLDEECLGNEKVVQSMQVIRASIDTDYTTIGPLVDYSEDVSTATAQKEDPQTHINNTPSMHNSSIPLNHLTTPASATSTSRANAALSEILSRTPRAAAFIEKHMSREKDTLLEVLKRESPSIPLEESRANFETKPTHNLASDFASELSPSASATISTEILHTSRQDVQGLEDDPRLINPLTVKEYEASPPIIKKLVSRDDLNRGIVTINNWLISQEGEMPLSLPEKIAVDIFGETFNASQVKRIFLSLCSVQRMMINRKTSTSGESEMHYVIIR